MFLFGAGSVVPCDVWHARPVSSRASEEAGAGRSWTGEERAVGAPQRPSAHQESAPCWADGQGSSSGAPADIRLGSAHRAGTTPAEGSFVPRLVSVAALSSAHMCRRPAPVASAGSRASQEQHSESDSGPHHEEEPGGDSHLNSVYNKLLM